MNILRIDVGIDPKNSQRSFAGYNGRMAGICGDMISEEWRTSGHIMKDLMGII